MNNLYHYGVKGMKWGVRKSENLRSNRKEKLHLGIDDRGNLNLIRGKTTTKAKKSFCNKKSYVCWQYVFNSLCCNPSKNNRKGTEIL